MQYLEKNWCRISNTKGAIRGAKGAEAPLHLIRSKLSKNVKSFNFSRFYIIWPICGFTN